MTHPVRLDEMKSVLKKKTLRSLSVMSLPRGEREEGALEKKNSALEETK